MLQHGRRVDRRKGDHWVWRMVSSHNRRVSVGRTTSGAAVRRSCSLDGGVGVVSSLGAHVCRAPVLWAVEALGDGHWRVHVQLWVKHSNFASHFSWSQGVKVIINKLFVDIEASFLVIRLAEQLE